MGIKLKEAGIDDFIILEKASELGGTWRENSYPGAECDIPSALYSYSFAPNLKWKHVWSKRDQIFQYQKDVVEQYELGPHFRFNQKVVSAHFKGSKWQITTETPDLETQAFETEHFICALGQLHERFTPTIEGADSFSGAQFHAAKWNHNVDLKDKDVVVIGSAASAVQLVPHVAKEAKRLTVIQRSPNWMIQKPNRRYTKLEHWLAKHLPFLRSAYRNMLYLQGDGILFQAIKGNKLAAWFVTKLVKYNLKKHVKDPELRAKLTPDYTIGAKRTLFSDTFYKTLNQPHVDLETTSPKTITEHSVVTESGKEIKADVIIYATGFITNPFIKSIDVVGRSQTLKNAWANGAQAYLGLYTAGFPNMHMMYGPNTNLGHNSIIIMIEAQASFITRNITELDQTPRKLIEVPSSLEQSFNQELQKRLKTMAFSKIGQSWYMDQGKITNNWAGTTWEYRRKLKKQKLEPLLASN